MRDVTEMCLSLGLEPVLVGSGLAVDELPPMAQRFAAAQKSQCDSTAGRSSKGDQVVGKKQASMTTGLQSQKTR